MEVPEGLGWLRSSPEGRAWLAALPGRLDAAVKRWSLEVGRPYPYAYASLAVPALLPDGTEAVLKLAFPDRESEHEAAALARWGGSGAVRLLDHDPDGRAMLIERCTPGTPLSDLGGDAALDVLAGLLPRLWVPAGPPFRTLAEEAAWWAAGLRRQWEAAGRPFAATILDAALEALDVLPGSQGEQVLVNQDLHALNVLRADREPWLVIDPKPLAGERAFGLAPVVRGSELGHGREHVLGRLDRLSTVLGLDRDRARRWALAQTVAWCFVGTGVLASHVEVARWLHEAG
jgi:streptomycin 6-kinase